MTLNHIISHEWKTRLSQPAVLLNLALFLICLAYAVGSGRAAVEGRLDAIALHEMETASARQRWLSDLEALEEHGEAAGVPAWSGSAMDVTFSSYLPTAPLADFAIGQSDLLPYVGTISLWEPDVRLFSRYEFEDPVALALGGFDLSKTIILVLPLVLIAVCFDVRSADRDANRLGLLLAQGAAIRAMFWRMLTVRAGVVVTLTLLACLVAVLWPGNAASLAQRLPFFALWTAACFLYAGFWIATIAVVVGGNRTGEANIIVLLLAWAAFTLLAPASMTSLSEAVYPTPSRAAYLAEARRIEIETELAEASRRPLAIIDHPELMKAAASSIPDYVRTAFLVTTAVDRATKPVLVNFQTAAERRAASLAWISTLSPAAIVQRIFLDIAGTSSARHRSYMSQARVLKAAYAVQIEPQVIAGQRLSVQQARSLPVFRFEEESFSQLVRRTTGELILLGFVVCLLLVVADWQLRRAERAMC